EVVAESTGAAVREAPTYEVTLVRSASALREHLAGWDALCREALEPNVFYEPWMLLPALDCYARGEELAIALVHEREGGRPPRLCGLFPFARLPRYQGLPIPVLSLWSHPHCYVRTPLVHEGCAEAVLQALFDFLAASPDGAPMVELAGVSADGPFHAAFLEHLRATGRLTFQVEAWSRALLRPAASADAYLDAVLSSTRRRKLRRAERLLAERGAVEFASLAEGENPDPWIEDFLALEAAGWKGREGTALASREEDRRFFTEAARGAAARRQLVFRSLRVGGRNVAMLCNFVSGSGAFAFKVAFDEAFAQASPGALLELEDIRRTHEQGGLRWIDSCTAPGAPLMNALWRDRRMLQTSLVETGRATGKLVVSLLPLLRLVRRTTAALAARPR
ncbi:MAG: GNAT family N-acetyltransferase, partial [Myxococcales bacterium]